MQQRRFYQCLECSCQSVKALYLLAFILLFSSLALPERRHVISSFKTILMSYFFSSAVLPECLTYLQVGTSGDLRVGQSVFAIGNPGGLSHTLTTGVVSGLNRAIPSPGGTLTGGAIQVCLPALAPCFGCTSTHFHYTGETEAATLHRTMLHPCCP